MRPDRFVRLAHSPTHYMREPDFDQVFIHFNREEEGSDDDQELGEELLSKLKKMKIGKSKKNCPVCLSHLEKDDLIRSLPCGHMYHNSCIKAWFKKKSVCPLCRMDIKKYLLRNN